MLEKQGNAVVEHTRGVVVEENPFPMDEHFVLQFYHVPGFGEDWCLNDKIAECIENQWKTFDCVVAVLDLHQGLKAGEETVVSSSFVIF